jgi:hypothetical protein
MTTICTLSCNKLYRSGGGFEFSSIFLQLRARISDHDAINEEPLRPYEPNSSSDSTSRHTPPPPNYPENDTHEE